MNAASLSDQAAPDWAAIAVVVLSVTAFAVAQGLTYPLISLVLESRGVPGSIIGLNAASFAAGLALATLSVGRLTTLCRGDRLIIVGLLGCSLCLAGFALSDQIWAWFAARFLLGFFASLIFMLSEAWLNTACPDHIRGRVSGLYGAGMCAGFAAGPLAIPLVGTEGGFAFAILAVYVALVAFASVALSGRTRTVPEQAPAGALFQFLRNAPILVLMVLAFGFADIAAISGMPVYFVRTGYSEAFAAYAITVMALPTALAQPVVGFLLDRTSRMHVAVGCGLIAAVTFLLIPLLASPTAILITFAVMGAASFALNTCALALLGERFSGGMLIAGSAAFSLAYAAGSATGSTATGVVMDLVSPAAAPISVGLVMLAFTSFFLLGVYRRSR